jgi:hypothetical protein
MTKYKILLSFILFVSAVSSCVTSNFNKTSKKFNNIDKDIHFYLLDYKKRVEEHFDKKYPNLFEGLTAGKSEIGKEGSIVGLCSKLEDSGTEIEVDTLYWEHSSDLVREILVFHEAGHCICNRDHTYDKGTYPESKEGLEMPNSKWGAKDLLENGYFEDKCPRSIMHSRMPSEYCIKKYLDHYLQEMLDGCELSLE